MEYNLIDADDNSYSLNGVLVPTIMQGSLQRTTEAYEFDREIVERSFLPGSVVLG